MRLLFALSLETGQFMKKLGGVERNSRVRPSFTVFRTQVSVVVVSHQSVNRLNCPPMGGLDLSSLGAVVGTVGCAPKWTVSLKVLSIPVPKSVSIWLSILPMGVCSLRLMGTKPRVCGPKGWSEEIRRGTTVNLPIYIRQDLSLVFSLH